MLLERTMDLIIIIIIIIITGFTPVPHLEVILYRVYGRKVRNVLHIGIT